MKMLLLLLCCLVTLVGNSIAQFPDYLNTEPKLQSIPEAKYPKIAKDAGVNGTVGVKVNVDANGNVTNAAISYGPGAVCESVSTPPIVSLRNAALEVAQKAKFFPAERQGKPIESITLVNIRFPKSQTRSDDSVEDTFDSNTSGENSDNELPKTLSKGIIDHAPVGTPLPKPNYPTAAKAVRASGTVPVRVLVLEDGTVYSARATGGHPLLQRASEIAACKARFVPTYLSGQPVRITGIISYNFVP